MELPAREERGRGPRRFRSFGEGPRSWPQMCGELPGVPSAPEGPGFSLPLYHGLACPHLALGLGLLPENCQRLPT